MDAYPINSRFSIASNGRQFLVEDKKTGQTLSWHNTYQSALKARNELSRAARKASDEQSNRR